MDPGLSIISEYRSSITEIRQKLQYIASENSLKLSGMSLSLFIRCRAETEKSRERRNASLPRNPRATGLLFSFHYTPPLGDRAAGRGGHGPIHLRRRRQPRENGGLCIWAIITKWKQTAAAPPAPLRNGGEAGGGTHKN